MKWLIISIVLVLALTLLVSGAGCKKAAETTADEDAEQFDDEISGLENASESVDGFNLDFDETELEQVEDLF